MRKKILIAEQSDAIRSIAESLLYQQGYDVLSAPTAEKAKELIVSGRPNMLIIGADLKDNSDQFLYDALGDMPQVASTPLLLIEDPQKRELPYPEEIVLPRPFDPEEFTHKVKLFVGEGDIQDKETITESDPFESNKVDEEFLDSALGLDRIEVEDSEILDKTEITGRVPTTEKSAKKDKDLFEIARPDQNGDKVKNDSGRVESLMIRETDTGSLETRTPKPTNLTASSKIEITDDQYGLVSPEEPSEELVNREDKETDPNHDYNWFINEMKKGAPGDKDKEDSSAKSPAKDSLHKTDNSDYLKPDKIIPEKDIQPGLGIVSKEPKINPGGVEQFISDFKKEIKQMSDDEGNEKGQKTKASGKVPSGNAPAELDQAELNRIAGHLVEILAEKLAKQLVERINKDDIYLLLKDDIAELISNRK